MSCKHDGKLKGNCIKLQGFECCSCCPINNTCEDSRDTSKYITKSENTAKLTIK